jgi:hypothetical protein
MSMIISFGIAVYATNLSTVDGENSDHLSDLKHGTIGLVIILLYASSDWNEIQQTQEAGRRR